MMKMFLPPLNPIRCNVWETEKSVGGGAQRPPPLGKPKRSCLRPHVAIKKLVLYQNGAHMKKNWLKYQKPVEISRFENLLKSRFCLSMTQKNMCNLLIFWDIGLIFWIQSNIYSCNKLYFEVYAVKSIFEIFIFFVSYI